ncbi:hypothetical protein GQX74_009470 [Glossina fuscipes]|nr:hypothetical protein GQX74_009470 [Glossina fuscipes]
MNKEKENLKEKSRFQLEYGLPRRKLSAVLGLLYKSIVTFGRIISDTLWVMILVCMILVFDVSLKFVSCERIRDIVLLHLNLFSNFVLKSASASFEISTVWTIGDDLQ